MNRRLLLAPLLVLALFATGMRRRPSQSGECPVPIVGLSTFPTTVCPGQPFTLRWSTTDPRARVTIEGLASDLGPFGAREITDGRRTFNARAALACVTGPIAHLEVPSGGAAIRAAESVVPLNRTTTLDVTVDGNSAWTVSSSLGNPIDPAAGSGSTGLTYFASRSGTDTVILNAASTCFGTMQRTVVVTVTAAPAPVPQPQPVPVPQPQPQPQPGGTIRCNDGTISPSYTTCHSGCCSGHGGCR